MSKSKGIFLIGQYYMKPRDHVNTSKSGWMKDPANIRWDEKVEFTRSIRNRDANAQVILNLSNKTVVRNTFNSGKSFDEVFAYFFENYSKYLIPLMGQLDPDYLQGLADKMTQEVDNEPVDVPHEEVKAE